MVTQPARFSIANVITNTFGLIARNAAVFTGLSFLLFGLPQIASALLFRETSVGAWDVQNIWAAAGAMGYALVFVLLYVILQSVFMLVAVRDLSGEPVSMGDCIRHAITRMPGVLGLFLVMAVAFLLITASAFVPLFGYAFTISMRQLETDAMMMVITFGGFLVMMVAYVVVYLMWMVALPVKIVENVSILAALGRSRQLTSGARLRLLVLLFVFLFSMLVIQIPVAMFLMFGPSVAAIASGVSSAINVSVGAAGVAAVYIELRGSKEGTSSDQLASVFA